MIGDSLRCEPKRASSLVQLVHEKTEGSPFFAIQFLTILSEEGLIALDPKTRAWTWSLAGINAKGFTDNLVDLMLERLKRLPSSAQETLKLLACLGNYAEIKTLEIVLDVPREEISASLHPAIEAGIIGEIDEKLGRC